MMLQMDEVGRISIQSVCAIPIVSLPELNPSPIRCTDGRKKRSRKVGLSKETVLFPTLPQSTNHFMTYRNVEIKEASLE